MDRIFYLSGPYILLSYPSSGTGKMFPGVIHAELGLKHLTDDEKKISTMLFPGKSFPESIQQFSISS